LSMLRAYLRIRPKASSHPVTASPLTTMTKTIKASIYGALLIGLAGCTDARTDCSITHTCRGTSESAGAAGNSGKGGAQQGGNSGESAVGGASTSGGTSSGGTADRGGSAGNGAAGEVVVPCNAACKGETPYCDETSNTCVACLSDGNCSANAPACDLKSHTCVSCTADKYCPKETPACDTVTHQCVICTADKYCASPTPACKIPADICAQCTASALCSGSTPICRAATNTCVQCTSSAECANVAGKPICDTSYNDLSDLQVNTCVECLVGTPCKDTAKPQCNLTSKTCVQCLSNADCKTAAASKCDTTTNTCVPCAIDTDCTQISGRNVCLAGASGAANQCVQCTGKNFAGCGSSGGKALVCDSLAHTCSTSATVQSAGLCQSCVSDAQCTAGKLCYLETFNSASVGYFCFWKQGDTANGAPADCTVTANRPYVKVENGATSIDGTSGTLCALRSTSCTAYNQFSNIDCAPSGTPSDTLCGFASGADSKCMQFGTTTYRCTTVCLSNDDCKTTCDTGAAPNVCTFQ
jgi:hypothetical protein